MSTEITIKRFHDNPILQPGDGWMRKNVFNCGVILDNDGLYKMLFRSAWTEDQSMSDCGLAFSEEGTIWYVLDKPVLKCGMNNHCIRGIEDPRIVKWVDGWKYIFATASSQAGGRIGIWRTKNFLKYEWVGIPFNQEDKDACIFPRLIGGWVYLMHRKAPHMWISKTNDITLKTNWHDSKILIKKDQWYDLNNTQCDQIGIAGPPIETPKGWLVITHVIHKYKEEQLPNLNNRIYTLSFMVLDSDDPTKVIYVHPEPILIPEEKYEINGSIPNVVFSCATVDTGGDLIYIYWGGADTVICGGSLSKSELIMCY